jgi:hypothetical protein
MVGPVSYLWPVRPRGLLLLLVGLALLGTAWVFSTPPGWAPDEPVQYLRALGISEGTLLGPREPLNPSNLAELREGGVLAEQQLWNDKDRRGVVVPASLSPPGEPCTTNLSDTTGSCTEVSYTGDYYPLAYLLPAVGIAASNAWQTALLLSRVGSLVQMLIFLVLAVILTGPKAGWRLVGLLAATTPMVLFIGSMMNPNGLEIAANLAFVAALLRLRRDPTGFPGWAWISLAASGVVTVLAWQLGPLFAVFDIAAWAGLMGTSGLRELYSARGSQVLSAAAIMTAAVALFVGYGGAAGVLHSTVSLASPFSYLNDSLNQLRPSLQGAVGDFGALTVPLPSAMITGWWVAVVLLFAGGLWLGSLRERVVLVLTALIGLTFPVVFFAFSYRFSGYGVQGRYILPILAITPMVAGDVIDAGAVRLRRGRVVARLWPAFIAAFGLFQLGAWWVNAHHYVPLGVLSGGELWSPPLGWRFWLVVACVGATAIAGAAVANVVGVAGAVAPAGRRPAERLE